MQHSTIIPAAHQGIAKPDPVRVDALAQRVAHWSAANRSPEAIAAKAALTDRAERTFDANVDHVTHPAFTSYAPANRDRFVKAMVALDVACAKRGVR